MGLSDHVFYLSVLAVPHWFVFALAAWRWPLQQINTSIGGVLTIGCAIVCTIVVLACAQAFLDLKPRPYGGGHAAGWFLVYSIATIGVLPLITLSSHVFAGKFVGLMVRHFVG